MIMTICQNLCQIYERHIFNKCIEIAGERPANFLDSFEQIGFFLCL